MRNDFLKNVKVLQVKDHKNHKSLLTIKYTFIEIFLFKIAIFLLQNLLPLEIQKKTLDKRNTNVAVLYIPSFFA